MEHVMETLFGNTFFQLPMLEALSYVAAFLMIGAAIMAIPRRLAGRSSPSSEVINPEEPFGGEWEWRKAA